MNYSKLLSWFSVAMLVFSFTACDNEPIPGGLIVADEGPPPFQEGIVAVINGKNFIADSTSAVLTTEGVMTLIGVKDSTGEKLTLVVENYSIGNHNLIGGPGTQTIAIYEPGVDGEESFDSTGSLGGFGQMAVNGVNPITNRTLGAFEFEANRIISEANGEIITETVVVTNGLFAMDFVVDDPNNNDDDDTGDNFFAKVDGVGFIDQELTVTGSTVSDMPMITVYAEDANGANIRIDIPETLGTGTFSFESLSDGTELIAIYQDGGLGSSLTSNPGSITITEFDYDSAKLTATFEFIGTDPLNNDPTEVEVTEGSFSVTYEPTIDNSTPPFTADIDGENYTPENLDVVESTFIGVDVITIVTSLGSQSIDITFPANLGVGVHAMSTNLVTGNEIVGTYIPNTGDPVDFVSDPGTFEITVYDTDNGIIEGTFSFSAVDQSGGDPTVYEITNGVFSIELP